MPLLPHRLILLACLLLIAALNGCTQHVDGGHSERATREFSLIADSTTGAVTVTDSRERAATSQPSSDTYGTTPEFKGTSGAFGEIGGLKFSELKAKPIGSWILGGVCLLAAGLSYYFTRNLVVAGVALAIGVAAFVLPTVLGIVAVAALVVIVLMHFGISWKRVIGSMTHGLAVLPPIQQEMVKDEMERKQTPSDGTAIKAMRPKVVTAT